MYPLNTFNSATYRNIANASGSSTSIFDTSIIPANGYAIILSIIFSNKSATARSAFMTLQKNGSANPAYVLYDVAVPPQTAFEIIDGNKFVIKNGDLLKAWVDVDGLNLVDAVVSYMVYTPAS